MAQVPNKWYDKLRFYDTLVSMSYPFDQVEMEFSTMGVGGVGGVGGEPAAKRMKVD